MSSFLKILLGIDAGLLLLFLGFLAIKIGKKISNNEKDILIEPKTEESLTKTEIEKQKDI